MCWHQIKQKERKDHNTKLRYFVRNGALNLLGCLHGVIVQRLGPLTGMIEVAAGKFWKWHVYHVKDYPSKGLSLVPKSPTTRRMSFSALLAVGVYQVKKTISLVKKVTLLLPVLQMWIKSWPAP